ncbi:periplasmic heavy metal sensor [Stella sp.]|uniref:periplasmic heavy metal sensor n=1 Tax=Stella sp. TaxID=2912054 RepID=UPI0035B1AC3D
MSDVLPATPAASPPRWRRWLLPGCLLVSLAVNVFLVSALVGRYARDHGPGPEMLVGFRGLTEGLPESARDTLRESFRARRGEIGRERRDLREARRRVVDALAAEPFDAAAARQAFEGLRDANGELARIAQDALIEAAGRMPAQERRELLQRRVRHPRQPGEGPPPGPPGGGAGGRI